MDMNNDLILRFLQKSVLIIHEYIKIFIVKLFIFSLIYTSVNENDSYYQLKGV